MLFLTDFSKHLVFVSGLVARVHFERKLPQAGLALGWVTKLA